MAAQIATEDAKIRNIVFSLRVYLTSGYAFAQDQGCDSTTKNPYFIDRDQTRGAQEGFVGQIPDEEQSPTLTARSARRKSSDADATILDAKHGSDP